MDTPATSREHAASKKESPFVLGICGAACSGKSAIVKYIRKKFAFDHYVIECLQEIEFYSATPPAAYSLDDYAAYDWKKMEETVERLCAGQGAEFMSFDREQMVSYAQQRCVKPCQVLVLQGAYFLNRPALAAACSLKVYLDTDPDELLTRFIRRYKAQIALDELLEAYLKRVKPAREMRTESCRARADFVLCNFDGHAKSLVEMKRQFPVIHVLKEYLRAHLSQQEL